MNRDVIAWIFLMYYYRGTFKLICKTVNRTLIVASLQRDLILAHRAQRLWPQTAHAAFSWRLHTWWHWHYGLNLVKANRPFGGYVHSANLKMDQDSEEGASLRLYLTNSLNFETDFLVLDEKSLYPNRRDVRVCPWICLCCSRRLIRMPRFLISIQI